MFWELQFPNHTDMKQKEQTGCSHVSLRTRLTESEKVACLPRMTNTTGNWMVNFPTSD